MVRTQIYLTEAEQRALRALLQQARGLWQDRTDLPDFAALRRELDRPAEERP